MNTHEPPYTGEASPLIDRVLKQMDDDFADGDIEAVDELLRFIPRLNLIQYLGEDEWERWATKAELKEIYDKA